ncbi:MAG TPA: acylphosphatase [Oleiagrimonas sp.]|nr:acylphosphatase [Oleiagrimonas sp.]
MSCVRFRISGRVQGVFFRASTRERALALGLSGHAINLDDGRVEVLAYGDETAIETLRQWLHQGPPAAKVQAVESEPLPTVDEPPTGFVTG